MVCAAIIAFCCTPVTIYIANKLGITTDRKTRKHPAHTHTGVLPRLGGIPIFIGILIPLLPIIIASKIALFIFLGAGLTVVVGVLDDRYDLSPYLRFFLNGIAAMLAVAGGAGIPFITGIGGNAVHLDMWRVTVDIFSWRIHLLPFADVAAILWIVWCMNMVNWSKGVDGQLPGFVVIAALFLGILSFRFSRHDISREAITVMGFVTAGAYLGFLPWNFYPQKILTGYAAGSLAGYLLAVLSILSWGKLGTLLLVLALPLTDALLVFARRIAHKHSPFRADRTHFHHTLLDMGWGRRRIAVFYWLVSLIVGCFSLYVGSEKKLVGFVMIFFVICGIVVGSYRFVKNLKHI
ncbi:MAG: MraY family glycosyltransferase [Patescibacteria group bacterium]